MLNPDLEIEYGWAIEAFRDRLGYGDVEVVHERKGRSLKVRARGGEYVLYEAPTTGEVFALNTQRNRFGLLQAMIDDAAGR